MARSSRWLEYAQQVERELRPDGKYVSIRGLANKLPEHATRLAAVQCLFENLDAIEVSVEQVEAGIAFLIYLVIRASTTG